MDFLSDNIFFFISKIAWALLSPSNLIIVLFALGTLFLMIGRHSAALKLLIPTSLVALVITAYPVSDWLMEPLEKRFPVVENLPEEVDGIIILGGGEDLPRSLSWQTNEIGMAGDRFLGVYELAQIYTDAPIIFTGGVGQLAMHSHLSSVLQKRSMPVGGEILQDLGIEPSRLIIENLSRNTFENFKNIKTLLPKKNGQYILITSAYHMPRSVGIARRFNIDVIPYPVDYRSNQASLRSWDFNYYTHLKTLEPAWKEWIGLTAYYITGKTDAWFPKPETE